MQLRALAAAVSLALIANMAYGEDIEPNRQTGEQRGPTANKPAPTGDAVKLPALTVTGSRVGGYTVPNATTATRTRTPIMETPFSISVVPQQLMRDQQMVNVFDALDYVAGVVPWGASQNVSGTFISRGFTNIRGVYRDGTPYYGQVGFVPTGFRDLANIQRIEFLKGPASILFGRVSPGGIINLITEKALPVPHYSIQQQIGSYNFYRTTLDATGPVTPDKSLLYRFNLAYQNAGSFRQFVTNNRIFVAPELRWIISPRTQATLELEYMHNEDTPDLGNVPLGGRPSPLPRERNLGESWSTLEGDRILVGLKWSHRFNDNWTLRHRLTAQRFDYKLIGVTATAAAPDGTVQRGFFIVEPEEANRYFTRLNLTGHFDTYGIKHTMIIGGDYFYDDEHVIEHFDPPGGLGLSDSNIFDPIHQPQPPPGTAVFDVSAKTSWYGLYLQDQMELPYNIHLLAGFRYDNATVEDENGITASKDDAITPRAGIVWRPIRWLSLYGSYSENFGAANGRRTSEGEFLPSETAQQWEAGLKTAFWNGRLRASVAWFDLTKQNIRTTDPNNPTRVLLVGEAETSGVEVQASGEILAGCQFIAAYTYMPTAKVTEGEPGEIGSRFQGVPKHSGSFWSTYEFQGESLRGFTVGAGVQTMSSRVGNNANTYTIPGYATVNLMGRYTLNVGPTRVSTQINVENLLDKRYFLGSNGGNHIPFGNPLTVLGSIRVDF